MGFLYYLLKDVKDKQPYSVGKNDLKNLVSSVIEHNLCSGHEGFKKLFEVLPQRIEAYNREVRQGNDNVKSVITIFDNHMKEMKTTVSKILDNNAVAGQQPTEFSEQQVKEAEASITEKLGDCLRYGKNFTNTLASYDVYTNDFNHNLSANVKNVTKTLYHERVRLKELSDKEKKDLKEMTEKIKSVLEMIEKRIKEEIRFQVENLVRSLKDKVWDIRVQLKGVNKLQKQYVEELDKWIEEVEHVLDPAIEKAQKILDEVTWSDNGEGKWNKIENTAIAIDNEVTRKVRELGDWRKSADCILKNAIAKCDIILGKVDKKPGKGDVDIKTNTEKLQSKAKELIQAVEAAKLAVGSKVEEALKEVGKMNNKLKEDMGAIKKQCKIQLQEYVKGEMAEKMQSKIGELVKPIYNKADKTGHLYEIEKKVKEYAEKFKEDGEQGFKKIVSDWIDDILTTDGVVNHKLDEYVTDNKRHGHFTEGQYTKGSSLYELISKQIVEDIGAEIQAGGKQVVVEIQPQKSIQKNFEAVKNGIFIFIVGIQKHLKKGEFKKSGNVIEKIVNGIGTRLEVDQSKKNSAVYYSRHLERAVEITLAALYAIARQAYEELEGLTADETDRDYGLGDSLEKAIAKITGIGQNVLEALRDPAGPSGPRTLGDDVLEEMHEILNHEIGRSEVGTGVRGTTGNDNVTLEKLINYVNHVKQEHEVMVALEKGNIPEGKRAGTLPDAIQSIQRLGLDALMQGNAKNMLTERDRSFDDPVEAIGKELTDITELINGKMDTTEYLFKDDDISKNGVKVILQELNDMLGTKSCKSWEVFTKGLQLITQEIEKLKDQISVIKDNINNLCREVKYYGTDVKGNLENLKEVKLRMDLKAIRNNIDKLRKCDLDAAIVLANNFISRDSKTLGSNAINYLQEFVSSHINIATSTLTTLARKQYVTSVKQLLTAFADKVSQELAPLPEEIERDLRIGFKGMMKRFEGELIQGENIGNNIKLLKDVSTIQSSSAEEKKEAFIKLSENFQHFFQPLYIYLKQEIRRLNKEYNERKHPQGSDEQMYARHLQVIYDTLNDLLTHLHKTHRYDYQVHGKLDKLSQAVAMLKPETFDRPNSPVLDGITRGLGAFVGELNKVYISAYDSQTFEKDLVHREDVVGTKITETKYELKEYGRNCANVCLTLLGTVYHDLCQLRNDFMSDRCLHEKVHLDDNNPLGAYFNTCGYHVSANAAMQNGELNKEKDGRSILQLLSKNKHIFDSNFYKGNLVDIHRYVERYYAVTHLRLITGAKPPTNIYAMCQWLLGLYYNPVYKKLEKQFKELFDKPDKYKNDEYANIPREQLKLDAYPEEITMVRLTDTLQSVCSQSYDILTNLSGHGHAGGRYASDFHTNKDNLLYPTDFNTLVCLLFDVLKRVHHQFYFLYEQCSYGSTLSGWQECWYGQGVGGSAWNCNTLRCPNQNTDQTAKQEHKQICNQNADCGLKSPLQSFLEDGLPGFLPHNVSVKGSGLSCATCIKTPGIPCKTPMGFSDIGHMASRRNIGSNIFSVLHTFCGGDTSSLSVLCSIFGCLLPSAPKTLGEMFAFYYNFFNDWDSSGYHRKTAFDVAVNKAYFEEYYNLDDCSGLFRHKQHVDLHRIASKDDAAYHSAGDLYSITSPDDSCYFGTKSCGSYIDSLSTDVSGCFSSKHAGLYLTWIIYTTETFYRLLCSFRDDCKHSCSSAHSKCRINGCAQDICKVSKSIHNEDYNHVDHCNSIVHCRYTHPTLYSRGFTFGDREQLNGTTGDYNIPMRTCKTFVQQLDNVCGDKSVLSKLINVTIPEFLFKIREPFIWLNVALWLLSLLYLTHIMVIRLDLLHIKSHLHSPSSHRIAAQSLLAAGRVNKLNRVFYLQP